MKTPPAAVSNAKPTVETVGLAFRAQDRWLVSDANFAARSGELIAFTGPNGAGKSTFLRLLANELKPTSGEVCFNDRSLAGFRLDELAKFRAYLPQTPALNFNFQAKEVVEMGLTPFLKSISPKKQFEMIKKAMAQLEIEHLSQSHYLQLSGGERQRVHIARIFAQLYAMPQSANRIAIFDEPVAALDLYHQFKVMEALRALANEGACVLVVLHDLNLAARFADRIILMSQGKIVADGDHACVFTPENIRAIFQVEARCQLDEMGRAQITIIG